MSNFGFGNHAGDDDDRDKNDNNANNPFGFFFGGPFSNANGHNASPGPGGANLGDFLGQLGNMLSGFGADMSAQGDSPVNYALSERIARQHIAHAPSPRSNDSHAVAESVRLVELWLDEATTLPAGASSSVAFGPEQWLDETLPTWQRFITPLAEKLSDAALGGVPEEVRGQLGPLENIMKQVNSMNFGTQLGTTLGELAQGVVLSTQWGVPLAKGNTAAIATAHMEDMAAKLGCEPQEALIYLAAREAAHHRLFQHIPWLVERVILDVEEYAAGLALDDSALQEAMHEFNPESMQNPSQMQEMMERLQSEDLSPQVVSSNAHARERLETILSLVEGWVDVVVAHALGDRIPAAPMIGAAWSNFRSHGSPAMDTLTRSVGISLAAPQAHEAAQLFQSLGQAVGIDKRDALWDHPDFLPVSEDLANPAAFISHVTFDEDDMDNFNPISEIEKLEQERQHNQDDNGNGTHSGEQ